MIRRAVQSRSAFTVLELLLALSLALVIGGTALALFGMVASSDRRHDRRFDEAIDLSFAQETLRKAMGQLVAAKPVDPEQTPIASQPSRGDQEGEGNDAEQGEESDEEDDDEPAEPADTAKLGMNPTIARITASAIS